jgi:hypothetical protein
MATNAIDLLEAVFGEAVKLGRFLRSHCEDEGLSISAIGMSLGTSRQRLQVSIPRAMQRARQLGYNEELFVGVVLQSKVTAANLRVRGC